MMTFMRLNLLAVSLLHGGLLLAANTAPVATPQTLSVFQGTTNIITLAGSDAEGDVLSFAVTSNPLHGQLKGTPPNLTYRASGDFTGSDSFTFTVSDASATSAPATVSIGISPSATGNKSPTVSLVSPSGNATYSPPATVVLTATAADSDGTIKRVDFFQGGTKIGTATSSPYTFSWANVPAGAYVLTAQAFDNLDARTVSAPVNISVQAGGGSTPGILQFAAANYTVAEGAGTATVLVNRVSGSAGAVTVEYSTQAASASANLDFTGVSGVLSWASGDTASKSITVPIVNDSIWEPTESFFVKLGNPAGGATLGAVVMTEVAITDDDPAPTGGPTAPILFVTQPPIPFDFTTIGSVFGNHGSDPAKTGRGGDLYIRYPDGTLKNLTAVAGFGNTGFQGANSIAVRDPSVHWGGTKALFSMVVGAPTGQYQPNTSFWQIYEITGFGQGQTPVITKVAKQPSNFNNVSPIYGTDGRILFTSDRPRNGQAHLYPQFDEYELAPTNTGLWSLDPASGDLMLLDHAPSGDFTPSIDSFGRVIFTRWDHLQRDQEADADALSTTGLVYGTFNYSDESANAQILANDRTEHFPEPRPPRIDLLGGTNIKGHTFNFFFPWMINEDGTEAELLNHAGRHELATYMEPSFTDDPNLQTFYNVALRHNTNGVNNFLHIKEDPRNPGVYFGTDAPEFFTHSGGQIVTLTGPPGLDADHMKVDYITDRTTSSFTSTPTPQNSGHYREPLPMGDGTLVAVHTPFTDLDSNAGTSGAPLSHYDYRLKTLKKTGTVWVADQPLTPGISKDVSFYADGVLTRYTGAMWELNPVEVRARPVPLGAKAPLGAPEQQVLAEEGISVAALQNYLKTNGLALVVSRNVTTRDHADKQQPYNLRVAGTSTQTLGAGGKAYDIQFLQFFQADQLRGYGLGYGSNHNSPPRAGRRVLAQPLHDPAAAGWLKNVGPGGSVQLGADGSMAAFVPARRAMTWQLTDPSGSAVVRERFWLTFQPGEIRTCASCHGLNTRDQANHPVPMNKPEALRELARRWKTDQISKGFPVGPDAGPFAFTLALKAGASKPLTIQASTDLKNWTPIGTNDPGSALKIDFADTNSASFPNRFYRAVQE